MDRIKLKGYINIAHKAGYLIFNGEQLENYQKKLYLVLYDAKAGRTTLKIVEKLKEKYRTIAIDNLGEHLSIDSCKIVGVKNKNLSDIMIKLIEG